MQTIIKTENLTKDYGGGKGVFNVNLHVKQGEIMGFLGPNGAGKTTTIRQLMGFVKPGSGTAEIFGMNCFKSAPKIQKRVGYLSGEIALFNDMRGDEFIKFTAAMHGNRDLTLAKKLIEYFEFDAKGKIKKMSKGTKQKVGLICAFMNDPEVYVLDEPTSGLDPLMQNKFIQLIKREKTRGKTILMSSHMFEEIEKTCDSAAIINAGKLVSTQSLAELRKKQRKTYRVLFADAMQAKKFFSTCKSARMEGENCVAISLGGTADALIKALYNYNVLDIETQAGTLEDLFLQFYTDSKAVEK